MKQGSEDYDFMNNWNRTLWLSERSCCLEGAQNLTPKIEGFRTLFATVEVTLKRKGQFSNCITAFPVSCPIWSPLQVNYVNGDADGSTNFRNVSME